MFNKIIERLYFHQKGNLALYDQMTGCLNRNWFERFASKQKGFITVCDLNGLKKVNDLFGHRFGDQLIETMGSTLRIEFYKDKVCRFGGDEFFIYTKEDPTNRIKRCQSIVDFSYGVCKIENENSFQLADQAMYEMKKKIKKNV